MFIGVPNSANGTSGQPNITSVHFRGSLARLAANQIPEFPGELD